MLLSTCALAVAVAYARGSGPPPPPPGALWLRYNAVSAAYKASFSATEIVCSNGTAAEPLAWACQELADGLSGMLGARVSIVGTSATMDGAISVAVEDDGNVSHAAWPPTPSSEAFTVQSGQCGKYSCITIVGKSGPAALYGAFRLLQMVRRELPLHTLDNLDNADAAASSDSSRSRSTRSVASLPVSDEPQTPLRMWDLWDNRDQSVERGYAGRSVFNYKQLPAMQERCVRACAVRVRAMRACDACDACVRCVRVRYLATLLMCFSFLSRIPFQTCCWCVFRYRDYARLLASTGINSIVWDNVNACGSDNGVILERSVLTSMTPLVALFFQYGIRSFVTPCYSSPIHVGNLTTADPYDAKVAAWWKGTAQFIATQWPPSSFGGFLIKADCEGEPGCVPTAPPTNAHRPTHLNVLADTTAAGCFVSKRV